MRGKLTSIQPLRNGQKSEVPRFSFGMNRASVPQKPLKRAYERDPVAIDAWKTDVYPAIAKRAKKRGAEIFFWDESGFRAESVQGKTWGVKGQTPIISVPGTRQSVSAAS